MSRLATTQVIGRPRGATSILPHCRDGPSRGWHRIMRVLFNVQESKGDLTRDHYLNSPPIEASLTEFSHTRKIPRWSGRDSNPCLRAQTQARSPLSHPTTLIRFLLRAREQGGILHGTTN